MPPLRPDKIWLVWGILLGMLGLILFNSTFFPSAEYTMPAITQPSSTAIASTEQETGDVVQSGGRYDSTAGQIVSFTKKVACQHNVQVINTMVEVWYLEHDGQWPKLDLSDIGKDREYFPKGIPKCPVTGEPYRLEPGIYRVMGHQHGNIDNPFDSQPERE